MVLQIVENLDDLQNIEVDLEEIGRSHARIISGQLSSKLADLLIGLCFEKKLCI